MNLYRFDARHGWSTIENFFWPHYIKTEEEAAANAGFEKIGINSLGLIDAPFHTEFFRNRKHKHEYDYILCIDVFGEFEYVAIKDLPSLIEALSKISSISQAYVYSLLKQEERDI